jgi:hypothetical protein
MRRITTIVLLTIAFLVCGNVAFSLEDEGDIATTQEQEQEDKCMCEQGGLGLKAGRAVAAFGYKSYYSDPECDTYKGLGIGFESRGSRFALGISYDMGVVGIGFGIKNPETTSFGGYEIGYDCGKCRLVWPITETK